MIKLIISFIILFFLTSCKIQDSKKITEIIENKKDAVKNLIKIKPSNKNINKNTLKYIVGDPYYIHGVKYIPKEDFAYNEIGLATFYNKELHNKKTINNDYNKVTELLGRHKTLQLPSIVKVTNLENGLSLVIKINDRHSDNSSLIQVSRKSAQLLKFYKNKITKVRVEVLSDSSKQMKVVTQSMNEINFNDTLDSAPTLDVSILDISKDSSKKKNEIIIEDPIEIGFENIENKQLYLKIYDFKSYNNAKSLILDLSIINKYTIQKEKEFYSLILGPLTNNEANNLVLSFISKGYKKTEFLLNN